MKRLVYISVMILAVLYACERKELVEEEIYATVTLTSEGAIADDALLRAVVYDRTDGHKLGYSFTGPAGGEVQVGAGLRSVMVHTFGCETAIVEGEDGWETLCVTATRGDAMQQAAWTKALTLHPVGADSTSVAQRHSQWAKLFVSWEPDAMYLGVCDSLSIPRRALGEDYSLGIRLRPVREKLDVYLTGIEGLEYVASATMLLVGCSVGMDAATGAALSAPTVVTEALYRYGTGLRGQFMTFGDCPGAEAWLLVMVTDLAGTSFLYEYPLSSVSGMLETDTEIVIGKPEVKEGGGLQPTLEDWHEIEIPVIL